MKTAEQCEKGLGEYRRDVLGRRQSEVCRITGKEQGYISQLECGKTMPPKWNREALIAGYQKTGIPPLTDEQFVVLIERSEPWMKSERERKLKEKALQKPMTETDPLFATAVKPVELSQLVDGLTREAQQILIQQYESQKTKEA